MPLITQLLRVPTLGKWAFGIGYSRKLGAARGRRLKMTASNTA